MGMESLSFYTGRLLLTGPLCQCTSIRLPYVRELHGNFRREHPHDKVRTHHPDLFTLQSQQSTLLSYQRGCPDDNRTAVSYLRIRDTWMGSGKPCTFLPPYHTNQRYKR